MSFLIYHSNFCTGIKAYQLIKRLAGSGSTCIQLKLCCQREAWELLWGHCRRRRCPERASDVEVVLDARRINVKDTAKQIDKLQEHQVLCGHRELLPESKAVKELEDLVRLQYPPVLQYDLDAVQDLLLFLHWFRVPLLHELQDEVVSVLLLFVEFVPHLLLLAKGLLEARLPLVVGVLPEHSLLLAEEDGLVEVDLLYALDQVVLRADALRLVPLQGLGELGDWVAPRRALPPLACGLDVQGLTTVE